MKTLKLFTAAVLLTGLSVSLYGQNQPTGDQNSFDASATVMNPLTIESVSDLNFGTIFNGLVAEMDPATGDYDNIDLLEGATEATFSLVEIAGATEAGFNIEINGGAAGVTMTGDGGSITLNLLAAFSQDQTNFSAVTLNGDATLNASGEGQLRIGGSIDLTSDVAEGTYEANEIPVVIDYNTI